MQSSNERELGMFEFDDTDNDILSTFAHFDEADINGDELLEALSNHNDNLFDDIDVDNDTYMNAPPQVTHPNPQSCGASGIIKDITINTDNSSHVFNGSAPIKVDTFRRRATLDGEECRPNINIKSNRRRGREKKKKLRRRNESISSEEPLFGGGVRRQSSSDGDFILDDDELSESDVASACSAPADLMALCGLYDDPTNSTPDVLDIHSLFLNPNNKQQHLKSSTTNIKGKAMVEMMYSGGGPDEETLLIRRRQQQLLQEERKLQEAAASQRPRRRKSHDGSLPLMDDLRMNMMQDSGSVVNPMYGDIPMSVMSGTNAPIKRRKSEPMMDCFLGEMNGGEVNDNGFGNSTGGRNIIQSSHSLDHFMGFPTSSHHSASTPPNTSFIDNQGKSALDVAVEEAQDKINHLKELLLVSRGIRNNGTSGGFSEQGQQQQAAKKNWWSSLQSELGGSGLNLNPSGFGPDQDLTIPSRRVPKKKPKNKVKKKPEPQATPAQIPLPDKPDPEILKLDPTKLMEKLKASMSRTTSSMKKLQEWDRANGLPKSHSQTMVNSNKSRKDLAKEAGITLDETEKEVTDEMGQENLNGTSSVNATA